MWCTIFSRFLLCLRGARRHGTINIPHAPGRACEATLEGGPTLHILTLHIEAFAGLTVDFGFDFDFDFGHNYWAAPAAT
jgi:hypothetical protein